MKTRLIGLGNTLICDDGVGVYVAREVATRVHELKLPIDVVESEVAGITLLDLMNGYDRVVLVDAVQLPGVAPGTVVPLTVEETRCSLRLVAVHEIDLPTAITVGPQLGYAVPGDLRILGVQTEDTQTFREALSPTLAAALPHIVDEVLAVLTAPEP